ncbi:MAG: hypothetical protein R2788_25310 [Saprospiraceae bacterium]
MGIIIQASRGTLMTVPFQQDFDLFIRKLSVVVDQCTAVTVACPDYSVETVHRFPETGIAEVVASSAIPNSSMICSNCFSFFTDATLAIYAAIGAFPARNAASNGTQTLSSYMAYK